MNNLEILAQHRDPLLLAEAIGWLHDYRKCSNEQLKSQARSLKVSALPRDELEKRYQGLVNVNLCSPPPHCSSCPSLIILLNDNKRRNVQLGQYLSRCHNTAHFDKQDLDKKDLDKDYGKQDYPGTKISSPFGFERDVPNDLTSRLWSLPWDKLKGYSPEARKELRKEVENAFSQALGDTRRPINEVDLWSWGLLVGSLYKAALAGTLLTGSAKDHNDLKWRLLGVRISGLDYILRVSRIPDLLARKQLLESGLDKVRQLLEVTYPLGSEVYRDENGSIYVVPDLAGLLEITDDSGTSLEKLIVNAFQQGTLKNNPKLQIAGEIQPDLQLEPEPWWGQDPKYREKTKLAESPEYGKAVEDKLPAISPFLSQKLVSPPDPESIKQFWREGKAADICTVCGLRPQGPGQKAADRGVCHICEERRADCSREWATTNSTKTISKTIWTDEVADANGRLALVAGQFYLDHWLDGTLVESLFLIPPPDPEDKGSMPVTSKTPSFSRLRRIWETTRRFWQEVQGDVLEKLSDDRRRLKIWLSDRPDLGPFHVYDLSLGAADLDVVWVEEEGGYLLSASNLDYVARQLGAEKGVYSHPAAAAIYVENRLHELFVNEGRQPLLRNPDARAGRKNQNLLAGISLTGVTYQEVRYAPARPIMAKPRTFMMLVPADKSLQVIRSIKEKYQQEMGKVRDRLPLHLGVVYANRRTPIRTVLEAGRAMLSRHLLLESRVAKPVKNDHILTLVLERDKRSITWNIPLKMGDGNTDDCWYPYLFAEKEEGDCRTGTAARREKEANLPQDGGKTKQCLVVHAADLRPGERVCIWPSTFDFAFLDTNARSFEIHYGQDGRRPRRTRPFYLEDLDRLEKLWGYLQWLKKAQRYQVVRTIEATREAWYGQDADGLSSADEVFSRFVADTLAGASWDKKWGDIPEKWQEELVQAGVRGELADLAELHMEILKE